MSALRRLWPFGRGHPEPDPEMERWREERPERRRRAAESNQVLTDSIARAERVAFDPTIRQRLTGYDWERTS